MSVTTTPPVPPPKKKGMGCLGCGCLVLVLLLVLFLGFVGGGAYLLYSKAQELTSATPADIPTPVGGDDIYETARQKVTAFNHDVKNNQAATLHLSADEINNLIARNPTFNAAHVHLFVTMNNSVARMQLSLPTDGVSAGIIKGRYINLDMTFSVHFDTAIKSVHFEPQSIKLNNQAIMDANNPTTGSNASFNEAFMRSFTPSFNKSFNDGLRGDPDTAALLDHTKSMEIKDGELVIETE